MTFSENTKLYFSIKTFLSSKIVNSKMDCIYIALFKSYQQLKAHYNTSQHSSIHTHTHIHTLVADATMQGTTCSSGAITTHTLMEESSGVIWSSVSCPRTLPHVDCRGWESSQDPLNGGRLLYLLSSHSINGCWYF